MSITRTPSKVSGIPEVGASLSPKTPEQRCFESFRAMMAVQNFVKDHAERVPSLHFALFVNQVTQRAVNCGDVNSETSIWGIGGRLRDGRFPNRSSSTSVPPEDIAEEMKQLRDRIEGLPPEMPHTDRAAVYFSEFARIAPCGDGNKRTAWLLAQGMLVASNLTHWVQDVPDPEQIPMVLQMAQSSGDLRILANIFASSIGHQELISSAPLPNPFVEERRAKPLERTPTSEEPLRLPATPHLDSHREPRIAI